MLQAFDLAPLIGPLRPLLAVASAPYGAAVRLRHALYDCGLLKTHGAPLPILSVGGLEAGGTGKTPMVGHLLKRLLAAGRVPGLLTRGYRRQAEGLQVRAPGEAATVARLGDEAAMLVAQGLDVAVAACPRRILGARALGALGCDCAVMDDGLAHRALGRAANIVMLRGELDVRKARLLPWGSLREPVTALGRADLVVLHYRDGPAPGAPSPALAQLLGRLGVAAPVLSQFGAPTVTDGAGAVQDVAGTPVVAAAGTARPQEIRDALGHLGADVRAFFPFADHAPFDPDACARLDRAVADRGAQALVVTAKDRIKLAGRVQSPLWTLVRPLEILDPADRLGQLLRRHHFLPT
jgi:tetraacyldisaccharide 4'-kinase